jgi:putative ABC transport system permease protein
VMLLVSESALLALAGAVSGVLIVYAGLVAASGAIEARYGLALSVAPLSPTEWMFLALVVGAGTLVGVIPAWKAYRSSLADGLSVKV